MNYIRCPHCHNTITHPALADIGQRVIKITCPQCRKTIVVKK